MNKTASMTHTLFCSVLNTEVGGMNIPKRSSRQLDIATWFKTSTLWPGVPRW
jgi:hypothetical protein